MPTEAVTKITPTTYGYARVSTREQNLDRQIDALREFGVSDEFILRDKASGKDFGRPAWRRLSARPSMRGMRRPDLSASVRRRGVMRVLLSSALYSPSLRA